MALRKYTGTRDEDGNKVIHLEYQKALDHLKRTADIFSRMTVGPEKERNNREQKTGRGSMKVSVREQKPPGRKPVQLGMMMACGALLEIQEFLLEDLLFLFVLLGLVTQDCIENLNSLLRYLQPTPNALHIKQNL